MNVEEKRPSNSVQLAREIGAWPIYSNGRHDVVLARRFLTDEERDLITTALRAYDKDK